MNKNSLKKLKVNNIIVAVKTVNVSSFFDV